MTRSWRSQIADEVRASSRMTPKWPDDAMKRIAEVVAERDAALAEVARLSAPPDDAEVAALSAFRDWANKHAAIWKMGAIKMNGKFSRFMDPDTDTAWIGFKAGFLATHAARRKVTP